MDKSKLDAEISNVITEHGEYPFEFFSILKQSENPNLDFETQNEVWSYIKSENWHSLDLSDFNLWAISDNGDLVWWNGRETILMNPRASVYLSEPVNPRQFLNLVSQKKVGNILPDDLGEEFA